MMLRQGWDLATSPQGASHTILRPGISGVPDERAIAVEREGATVFFVPTVELKAAESKASPQLHVYAVHNIDQVLRILKRLGGHVPTKPVPVQAAP